MDFSASLKLYFRLQQEPEDWRLIFASSLLAGEARRWRLYLRMGAAFPEDSRTMKSFPTLVRV